MTITGALFVSPHAIQRFRERIAPGLSDEEIRAAIVLALSGLDGEIKWRPLIQADGVAIVATIRHGSYTFRAVLREGKGKHPTAVATILEHDPPRVFHKKRRAERAAANDEAEAECA